MPTMADIQALADRIAEAFHPEKIILFGSYAYGQPTEDSDVDLLVVLPYEGRSAEKSVEILARLRPSFAIDLIARRPDETERRYVQGDALIREAVDRGKTLFSRDSTTGFSWSASAPPMFDVREGRRVARSTNCRRSREGSMSEVVDEWISKAEADFATATREMAAPEPKNLDAVYLHALQCVEKLMKALLTKNGVVPPKVHDLVKLDTMLRAAGLDWAWGVAELRLLSWAAIDARYPGDTATEAEASACLDSCRRARSRLVELLGPSESSEQNVP
ncbi:MAG: HEPN domain-containing protein [Planctomycetes bacterium]|nr:HEPN domain-containing protein [Planctomycetota bacterium]